MNSKSLDSSDSSKPTSLIEDSNFSGNYSLEAGSLQETLENLNYLPIKKTSSASDDNLWASIRSPSKENSYEDSTKENIDELWTLESLGKSLKGPIISIYHIQI